MATMTYKVNETIIDVTQTQFTIQDIYEILQDKKRGRYKILVHVGSNVYEACVRWDGNDFVDLYELPHN